MVVTIEKTDIVIRIPRNAKPAPSTSGKTLVVASSGGFMPTTAEVDGKPLKVNVTAVISR